MLERVRFKREPELGLDVFLRSTTLVFGPPKVGKTTFASTFPDALIVECEPHGADYVTGWSVDISSRDELRDLFLELREEAKAGKFRWRVVVLDTIDAISEWVERDVAPLFGKEALAGPSTSWGADYAKHRAEVLNIVKGFQTLPSGLVIVAHSRREDGDRNVLALPAGLARALMASVNNIIYLGVAADGTRRAYVSPLATLESGSRDPILGRLKEFTPTFSELARLYQEEMEKVREISAKESEVGKEKGEEEGREPGEGEKESGGESAESVEGVKGAESSEGLGLEVPRKKRGG